MRRAMRLGAWAVAFGSALLAQVDLATTLAIGFGVGVGEGVLERCWGMR